MIFIDTGAWIALSDATDKYHAQAVAIQARLLTLSTRWLTTNFVVGETYTLLHRVMGFNAAAQFIRTLRTWGRLELLSVTHDIEIEAEVLLNTFNDQPFSYVDAVSFIVMRRQKITEAFAFDHHFRIAGFTLAAP